MPAMPVANRAPPLCPWWAGLAGQQRQQRQQSAHPGLCKRKILKTGIRVDIGQARGVVRGACVWSLFGAWRRCALARSRTLARWGSRLGYHPRQSSRFLPFFLSSTHRFLREPRLKSRISVLPETHSPFSRLTEIYFASCCWIINHTTSPTSFKKFV